MTTERRYLAGFDDFSIIPSSDDKSHHVRREVVFRDFKATVIEYECGACFRVSVIKCIYRTDRNFTDLTCQCGVHLNKEIGTKTEMPHSFEKYLAARAYYDAGKFRT